MSRKFKNSVKCFYGYSTSTFFDSSITVGISDVRESTLIIRKSRIMASSMASSIFLSHIYIFEEKKQQVPRYATLKYYTSVKNIQFYRFIFLVWFKSREVASCLFVCLVGFCSRCFDFFATVLTITFSSAQLGTIYKMGPWDCR